MQAHDFSNLTPRIANRHTDSKVARAFAELRVDRAKSTVSFELQLLPSSASSVLLDVDELESVELLDARDRRCFAAASCSARRAWRKRPAFRLSSEARTCVSHISVHGYRCGQTAHSMPTSSIARRGSCKRMSSASPVSTCLNFSKNSCFNSIRFFSEGVLSRRGMGLRTRGCKITEQN